MDVVNIADFKRPPKPKPVRRVANLGMKIATLQIGESFSVPDVQKTSMRSCVSHHKQSHAYKRFTTWMVGDRCKVRRLPNGRTK